MGKALAKLGDDGERGDVETLKRAVAAFERCAELDPGNEAAAAGRRTRRDESADLRRLMGCRKKTVFFNKTRAGPVARCSSSRTRNDSRTSRRRRAHLIAVRAIFSRLLRSVSLAA